MKPDACAQEHLRAPGGDGVIRPSAKPPASRGVSQMGVLEFSGGGCELSASAAAAALISIC